MKVLFILLSFTIFFSCKKDEVESGGTLSLQFNASYDNAPFEAVKAYAYQGKQSIKFSKFDFFITGLELTGTTSLTIDQPALIDLSNSNTLSLNLTNVPAGNYTGIRFNIGVKPDLNKKLPKDFPSTNPLASSSHYWDTWNSYIFSKIEGVVDTGGLGKFELGFAIHTGSDACLVTYTLNKNISISDNTTSNLSFNIDVKKLFIRGNMLFDLASSPLNHNPSNIETLRSFSSKFPEALSIKN